MVGQWHIKNYSALAAGHELWLNLLLETWPFSPAVKKPQLPEARASKPEICERVGPRCFVVDKPDSQVQELCVRRGGGVEAGVMVNSSPNSGPFLGVLFIRWP